MKPTIHVQDKVAVITGASRGIGEATARCLADHGAKVVLAARKIEELEAVAASIRDAGGEAVAVPCHVGKSEQTHQLVASTVERWGGIDVLVNNAATNPYFGPMLGTEIGAWHKTFEVNLEGAFNLTRAVAQNMLDRKASGSIINMSSIMGLVASPLQGVYSMTKAALISMTKTLAVELGPFGIRVNAIAPGLVETKFASAILSAEDVRAQVVERTPAGRVGAPEDIAGAALYLASDAASFVTGHTLVVDGGYTLG